MICVERIAMGRVMSERAERLRQARIKAGYHFASDAANALGIVASTYRAHENGQNEFELAEAEVYGRKFNVDPVWLLRGKEQQMPGGGAAPPSITGIGPRTARSVPTSLARGRRSLSSARQSVELMVNS